MTFSGTARLIEKRQTRTPGGFSVRQLSVEDVDSEFIARWAKLEAMSLEGNAFLSPGFVLAAVEHLPLKKTPFVVAVEEDSTGELIGLGVFEEDRGNRLLPLTHLRSWACDHSFTNGLLLAASCGDIAADALFSWVVQQGRRWHGLAFSSRTAGSELDSVLTAAAARAGLNWYEDWHFERACIPVEEIPEDSLATLYSKSRRKSLRRDLRKLQTFGQVEFEVHTDDPDGRLLEEFLRLEACGWKGQKATALASTSTRTAFCRTWMDSLLAAGRAAISELTVNGRAVAMSLNAISGETLFAFKIGWDTVVAMCSPGTLCELFLMQSLQKRLPGIRFVDSCAKPNSYIEKVWPWKFGLTSGVFPTTMLGGLAAESMLRIKQVKRLLCE